MSTYPQDMMVPGFIHDLPILRIPPHPKLQDETVQTYLCFGQDPLIQATSSSNHG